MREDLFEELIESVRQAGAIMRGEMKPSRVFVSEEIDVSALRARFGLSQPRFAALLGISVGTLRNWEQGRRRPEGPARVLLRIAASNPEAVLAAAASEFVEVSPDDWVPPTLPSRAAFANRQTPGNHTETQRTGR
jgi:putative transcriptional regulator